MKTNWFKRVAKLLPILLLIIIPVSFINAQELVQSSPIEVKCGTIIDGEFTNALEQHTYLIGLGAGDKLSANIVPIGTTLKTRILFYGPTKQVITGKKSSVDQFPKIETDILSANGVYTIEVSDFYIDLIYKRPAGVGVYTLSVSCIKRDGTIINAGDNNPPPAPAQSATLVPQQPVTAAQPPANFTGFPGLQPVDFSSAFLTPFTLGDAFTNGQMPATGNVVIGYTFMGNAGQTFDLTYLRRTGNLNLGLVVLSPTNKVVFITGMVTSDLLVSRFTLQESGQYTIGIFALNLVAPAAPEATSFQIKGILT